MNSSTRFNLPCINVELNSSVLIFDLQVTKCYFEEGYLDTSVYLWEKLPCGYSVQGPAIIIDKNRQAFSLSAAITTLSDPL